MPSALYKTLDRGTATTSTEDLLDPTNEGYKPADDSFDTDAATQFPSSNTPATHPDIDHNILRIWDNRYKSLGGFAAYVQWCLVLGWKECMRLSAWFWKKSWTAEVCSFMLAIFSLVTLVLTLLTHQDKPLPEWPQLITINSIVSLIALFMRIGVSVVLGEGISQSKWQWFSERRALHDMDRFDLASRSAWGSVRLLYSFRKHRLSYIAALGAVATIMTSLTGFFVQQLVQFQDCLQPDIPARPGVSKTNIYLRTGFISDFAQPFEGVVAAINVAVFQPVQDYTSVLTHNCTSGNCTFPAVDGASFSTIAISHSCENITSQAYIPDLPSRTYRNDSVVLSDDFGQRIDLDLATDNVLVTRTDLRFNASAPSLTTIHMIVMERAPGKLGDLSSPPAIAVLRCSLFPSRNTYGVNITNSKLQQSLIDSVPLDPYDPKRSIGNGRCSYLTLTNNTLRDGVREECTESTSDNGAPNGTALVKLHKPYKLDGTVKYEENASYHPADCVWCFGDNAQIGTQRYFRNVFDNQTLSYSAMNNGTSSSIYLRQLWQERKMTLDGMNGLMDDLAKAITAVVRTEGYEGDIWRAKGTMWVTTTCMHIKWPWLIFPIATVALTGVFLSLVMIENRGVDSQRLWKSSILATLLCEVQFGHKDKMRLESKESMDDMAKSTNVRLEDEKGTLKLVSR